MKNNTVRDSLGVHYMSLADLKKLSFEGVSDDSVELIVEEDYGDARATLVYYRPETIIEKEDRERREERWALKKEEKDRAEFERLKAKYEGK